MGVVRDMYNNFRENNMAIRKKKRKHIAINRNRIDNNTGINLRYIISRVGDNNE